MAELALTCCKVLLEKCPVQNGERALELLQRIGAVASLNRKAAAEEVGSLLFDMHQAHMLDSAFEQLLAE